MKKSERIKKEIEITKNKINSIIRHLRNVQDNCILLGNKFIEMGKIDLGKKLIANGMVHDASKFHGIEFDNLSYSEQPTEEGAKLKLKISVRHHQLTNPHHPEHWINGIKEMPKVYLYECICDWKSRSEEFGTSLRDWIDNEATKRYGFTKEDKIYKEILEIVDLLCPKPFENVTNT